MKETLLIALLMSLFGFYANAQCSYNILTNTLPGGASWQGNTTYTVSVRLYNGATPQAIGATYSFTCSGDGQACNTLSIVETSDATDRSNGILTYNVSQTSSVPNGVNKVITPGISTNVVACTPNITTISFATQTLPVNLISFNAEKGKENVLLTWTTATEKDNEGFQIERSKDGINFEIIGNVEGAGNSQTVKNYSFEDRDLPSNDLSRVLYYRLKQMDFDGSFEYSPIENVMLDVSNPIAIGKIMTQKEGFSGTIVAEEAGDVDFIITDLSGKVLQQQQLFLEDGENRVDLDLNAPEGIYLFTIKTKWGVESRKFVKG